MKKSLISGRTGAMLLAVVATTAACERVKHSPGDSTVQAATTPAFSAFADTYFDSLYAFLPTAGVANGFHQYDDHVENFTAEVIQARIAFVKSSISELDSLRAGALTTSDSIDAAILDGALRSELQEYEVIRSWRVNPMMYVGAPGEAVNAVMKREYAPAIQRLRSATIRLRGIPAMLADMRANITGPVPKEFADLALVMAQGSVDFFQHDMVQWAKGAAGNDTATYGAFKRANDSAVVAMQDAAQWLQKTVVPKANGTFALGAKVFLDKLKYDEMIDVPLDKLLAIGEANLAKDHKAFVDVATQVAPGKPPEDAMAVLEKDHPTAANLIPSAQSTVARIRQFVADHKLVDIPSDAMPTVTATPQFERTGVFAAMDTPGAYEVPAGHQAYYYVTPVEKTWDAKRVEEHLKLFNKSVMDLITVHEVFPGHYLQFLYAPSYPTKVRKLVAVSSNAEGWAHYGEQMMVEEGFGNGDPKIRLAQLEEALLRDCRYVAGIKEHTQGMSVQQAADEYFVKQCFQQPANAFEEARRGAYNPTYLYYTLGKLAIYKLRDDYKRAKGDAYSLREFHDAFVKQGSIPIPLVRKILLPGDTASVL